MKKLSLIYNLDSRRKWLNDMTSTAEGEGGCRSIDFFTHGLFNKIAFLRSPLVEIDVFVYIDEYEPVPSDVLSAMDEICKACNVKWTYKKVKHSLERFGSKYGKHNNDLIYVNSLAEATGDYVAHFDSDIAAFRRPDYDITAHYIDWLERYKYVSCQSLHSPNCIDFNDPAWKHMDYMWASTRFFICKRETLPERDELIRCFNNGYLEQKYGKLAKPNIVEHILGVIAGDNQVFYPPVDIDRHMVISWATYYKGVLDNLNSMEYPDIAKYIVEECGGIHGANDVVAKPFNIAGDI